MIINKVFLTQTQYYMEEENPLHSVAGRKCRQNELSPLVNSFSNCSMGDNSLNTFHAKKKVSTRSARN